MGDLTHEERQRIYAEEKARLEQQPSEETPRSFGRLPKNVALSSVLTLALLAGVGGIGYREYRLHGLKEKLAEAIGRDLGLTETILKIETDSGKITYAEVFDLCNKSVENRTDLIVELRGLYPDMDYQLKTKLIDYLSAENEFVRAKRDFYRREMEESSAADYYVEQLKDYPSSSYGWDYYRDRLRQTKAKLLESSHAAEESADEFLKVYDKMAKQEMAIASEAHSAGLRFETIFQKQAKANRKSADDAKEGAQKLASL